MNSRDYKKFIDRYARSSVLVLGPRDVMCRLLGALMVNLEQAKEAHSRLKLDVMFGFNRKSLRILGAIRASFSDAKVDEPAQPLVIGLQQIYRDIFIRLANVLRARDSQAEFDHILVAVRSQYQVWSAAPARGPAGPPIQAVPPSAARRDVLA